MDPRRTFWGAILAYGLLSAATFVPSARGDLPSAVGAAAGILVAAAAGYALRHPSRAGGPEEWTVTTLAAVGGAALYAVAVVGGAL